MLALFPNLPGGTEWLVILIIALLLFGSRLPSVMRSMGQSIKEFKRGMDDRLDEEPETQDHIGSGNDEQTGSSAPAG
jgi:sec-independent protein translocase protein TatA